MFLVQSSLLGSLPFLQHGFLGPDDAESLSDNCSFQFGDSGAVVDARSRAAGLVGADPAHLTLLYQEHGTAIHPVRQDQRGAGALQAEGQLAHGDGMVTADSETPLAILTADCLPIFIADKDGKAIGLAHAGWRGTNKAIASKLVSAMQEQYGVDPSNLLVWIGPGISFDYFEVGEDVWAYFIDGWCQYSDCFDPKARCIDLQGLNQNQLLEAGVPEEHIEICEDCTVEDERYYSYRRQGAGKGHNLSILQMKK